MTCQSLSPEFHQFIRNNAQSLVWELLYYLGNKSTAVDNLESALLGGMGLAHWIDNHFIQVWEHNEKLDELHRIIESQTEIIYPQPRNTSESLVHLLNEWIDNPDPMDEYVADKLKESLRG